jgi:hypothetical protein
MRDPIYFFHTIAPNRISGSSDVNFANKFTSLRSANLNTTLVIIKENESSESIPINIFANEHWQGNPSVILNSGSDGVVFFGGFPGDIYSDGLFADGEIANDRVRQIFEIGHKSKDRAISKQGIDFWGDQTIAGLIAKLQEIGRQKKTTDTIYSTTQYRLVASSRESRIASNKHRNTLGAEQMHNESHVQPSLSHIHSVAITKRDYERISSEWIRMQNKDILVNSGNVVKILALKIQKHISNARKKLLSSSDEEGKRELDFCIDVELSKSLVILQKLALFHEQIKFNEENTDLKNNPRMRRSFFLKKRKEPRFDENSSNNQEIWIKSQNEYLRLQIQNLQREMIELEKLYDFKINVAERGKESKIKTLSDFSDEMTQVSKDSSLKHQDLSGLFKTKLDMWQEKIKENSQLRESIKESIKRKLEKKVSITIFDKDKQTIEIVDDSDLRVYVEELKKDPLIIYQLIKSNLFDIIDQVYPTAEEKESAIIKSLEESLKKEKAKNLLEIAIEKNQEEVIDVILKYYPQYKNDCLIYSAQQGKADLLKKFLEKGIPVDPDNKSLETSNYSALMIASKNGNLEIVKLLIENGTNVNIYNKNSKDQSNSAIMYASENGHLEIVKLLIENGANANHEFNGNNALSLARKGSKFEVARFIVSKGFDSPSSSFLPGGIVDNKQCVIS